MQYMVRVRFAPSPTGIPHIGNIRTAFFNFLWAKHNKGTFILRIEDTDQKRVVKGAEESIRETLEWLGLKPDKEYKQSERLNFYKKAETELLDKGVAYKKEGATFVKIPKEKNFSWTDAVGSKEISFRSEDVEDFVIMKSDKFPTYHLANVVDDHLMDITHVIRGEEWISSTPKHLFLYESFEWKPPVFAHLPVILGPDRTKLSKRHGAESIFELRDRGFLKESILNFMVLLGWNPGQNAEVMSQNFIIEFFELKDINTSNPIFDIKKLEWMNGVYIRMKSTKELAEELKNFSYNSQSENVIPRKKSELYIDDKKFNSIVDLAKTRMTTLRDFFRLADYMFFFNVRVKYNKKQLEIVKNLKEKLGKISNWNKENILNVLKDINNLQRVRMSEIYKIFTSSENGLPLPESLETLGKEETLRRLK